MLAGATSALTNVVLQNNGTGLTSICAATDCPLASSRDFFQRVVSVNMSLGHIRIGKTGIVLWKIGRFALLFPM